MAREGLQSCCSAVFISAWLQGTFLQDAIIEAHDGQDGQKAITLSLVLHQPAHPSACVFYDSTRPYVFSLLVPTSQAVFVAEVLTGKECKRTEQSRTAEPPISLRSCVWKCKPIASPLGKGSVHDSLTNVLLSLKSK